MSSKEDTKLTINGLKHWYERLNKISGVKFHLHQFRHTFASKLAEADVNLFKIQKMMGHTDIKMTERYARSLQTQDMAEDIGKISI
jgi:integrase